MSSTNGPGAMSTYNQKGTGMHNVPSFTHWPKSFTDLSLVRNMLSHQFWRKIFSVVGPSYILRKVEGCTFYCYLKDGSGPSRYLIKHSQYEPFLTSLIKENMSATGSFLDIGANLGYYSVICSKLTSGAVFSFEPEPQVYSLFERNIKENGCENIRAFNLAASDSSGEINFYVNKFNLGDHRAYQFGKNFSHKITVNASRVDDVLAGEVGADRIDVIKIDVQGFEYFVVKGLVEILKINPGVKVFTEFEPKSLAAAGVVPADYLKFFFDRGFEAFVVDEGAKRAIPSTLDALSNIETGCTNILFRRAN
jgi:FkbM family methyltransferase